MGEPQPPRAIGPVVDVPAELKAMSRQLADMVSVLASLASQAATARLVGEHQHTAIMAELGADPARLRLLALKSILEAAQYVVDGDAELTHKNARMAVEAADAWRLVERRARSLAAQERRRR
ncbi:MAG: hypothetical protein RLZZ387_4514 [Chloroflexota bacterium]|jgi:hypothetical protein